MANLTTGRVDLILPVPPRLNSKYRYTRQGRVFVDPKHVQYGSDVHGLCLEQQVHKLTGDVGVEILFYEEKKRKQHQSDIDSILKTLLDSLNGLAYEDDKQITELKVQLVRGAEKSLIEMTIYELD